MTAIYSIGRSVYDRKPRFAVCTDATKTVVVNVDGSVNEELTERMERLISLRKTPPKDALDRLKTFAVNMSSISLGIPVSVASLEDAQAHAVDTMT